ncbi:hypothetical protein GV054_15300 [Marinomonas mediterranea]|uniref:hypothetical protein n=1 Tax=Marinomonas mediterranea TaxID=119864 RepID=UPI00234A0F57|nr:hypothetical protein [Marinomonas mediterranea]WCN14261.1 hypothetical protein GV054_15300 [Marinomonas mediterranea]
MNFFLIILMALLISSCSVFPFSAPEMSLENLFYIEKSDFKTMNSYDPPLLRLSQNYNSGLYVINLKANKNILEFLKENGVYISSRAYFCDQPLQSTQLDYPEVYFNKKARRNINYDTHYEENFDTVSIIIIERNSKEIKIDFPSVHHGQKFYLKHNLANSPEDVCVYLRGSDILFSYETNKVRVSSELLEEARKNAYR